METLALSRLRFARTNMFHLFFVPLTLGFSRKNQTKFSKQSFRIRATFRPSASILLAIIGDFGAIQTAQALACQACRKGTDLHAFHCNSKKLLKMNRNPLDNFFQYDKLRS